MVDIILCLTCVIFLLTGVVRGFLYLILNFLSLGLSIYLAYKFQPLMYKILKTVFNISDIGLNILSYIGMFVLVFAMFAILHRLIDAYICKNRKLFLSDRILGFITGLIISILCLYGIYFLSNKNNIVNKLTENSYIISNMKGKR